MADNDTPQSDRTEQATPKRLQDSRRRGQVPRSRELAMTLVMLVSAGMLLLTSRELSEGLGNVVGGGLQLTRGEAFDAAALPGALAATIGGALRLLAPLWIALCVAALLGSTALGGWSFSMESMAPKLEKLNPLTGLKRVFGWNGFAELGKALAKFLIVAVAGTLLLVRFAPEIFGLGLVSLEPGLVRAARVMAVAFAGLAAALVLIAAVDVPLQLWQYRRRLRMTKQEVKDEAKETEGRPEVRSRIRSAQQAIATSRMMAAVPTADVIATNPTHYAVALRYDAATMKAPKVVAKGADLVALNIRRIAAAHNVPVFEHPPLARALFHNTRLGQEVSPRLYVAVAQVLTYVYQLKGTRPVAQGGRPVRPRLDIDAELLVPAAERREHSVGEGRGGVRPENDR